MVSASSLLLGWLNLVQAKVVGGHTSVVLVLEPDHNWVQDAALRNTEQQHVSCCWTRSRFTCGSRRADVLCELDLNSSKRRAVTTNGLMMADPLLLHQLLLQLTDKACKPQRHCPALGAAL